MNGVEWRLEGDVTTNLQAGHPPSSAKLSAPLTPEATALDFWNIMMPHDLIESTLTATNLQAEMEHHPLTHERFLNFFGVLFAMTLAPDIGERRNFWEGRSSADATTLVSTMNLARFMSRHDFELILRNLRLCEYSAAEAQCDPWVPIRAAVESFNKCREACIFPGPVLCGDESMGAWRGMALTLQNLVFGLPHCTKIRRKPQGIGTEYKNLACGQTKIMLRLEIQEGKEIMRAKEFAATYGAGTSTLLRLTHPYAASERTVVADSAFASFKTAEALLTHRGLYFIGLVKTATKQFPKAWLQNHTMINRGEHAVLQTVLGKNRYMAVVWNDKKRKMFIASTGNTLPASTPASKHRLRPRVATDETDAPYVHVCYDVPRPAVVQQYFDAADAIDVHNHFRQGGVRLEHHWHTHTWWHRNFATLLGMCETDAFLAFTHFHPDKHLASITSHKEFTEQLSAQLLTYKSSAAMAGPAAHLRAHDQPPAPAPHLHSLHGCAVVAHTLLGNMRECPEFHPKRQRQSKEGPHQVQHFQDGEKDGGRVPSIQRQCSVCHIHKTCFYCEECSTRKGDIVPVCTPIAGKNKATSCYAQHIDSCAADSA